MPELRDVSTDQQNQGLAANLVIDRDSASRLGITAAAIDQVLYDAFGQREVSTMYTALNQYFVVMEVDPQYQLSPDALNGIFIKSSTGAMVPLSAIAHYRAAADLSGRQSPGPVPGRHAHLQPGAQRGPGRRRHRARKSPARDGHALNHSRHLPGNRAGLPGFA